MSLVVVAAAKGTAGVTTTATALAAVWPTPAALADCDPGGGDVALRLRGENGGWLAGDRGIVGLAAAARTDPGRLDVGAYLQTAVGGLPVLVGVDSPAQAMRIGPLWRQVGEALAHAPMDVVADCGRLLPGLPSADLVAQADLLVLAARPTAEAAAHLRHLLAALTAEEDSRPARVHVAVISDVRRHDRDVDQVRGALASVLPDGVEFGWLAEDAAAAAGLAGTPTRGLDRSSLVASARALAQDLYARVHRTPAEPDYAPTVVDVPPPDVLPAEVG